MNNRKKAPLFYNIFIGILCVVFLIFLFVFIFAYKENHYSPKYSAELLYYYLETKDYQQLSKRCTQARLDSHNKDTELQELYAVADYYHNAFYYYGFKDDPSIDVSSYQEKMKESAALAGDLSYAIEDIDNLFISSFE